MIHTESFPIVVLIAKTHFIREPRPTFLNSSCCTYTKDIKRRAGSLVSNHKLNLPVEVPVFAAILEDDKKFCQETRCLSRLINKKSKEIF